MPSPNASSQGQSHASSHSHLWLDLLLNAASTDGTPVGSDVVQALVRLARGQDQIVTFLESIMATLAEVQAEVATLKQTVADGLARIQAHEDSEATADTALQAQVAALTQANTDLQTQIDALKAAGTDTTALDAILADLKGVETSIGGIDPAPAPAPETPVP